MTDITIRIKFILLLCEMSKLSAAEYFHEPSLITIHPNVSRNYSDFGFAMGYLSKSNKLVVGAPTESLDGKVYTCDIEMSTMHKALECQEKSYDVLPRSNKVSNQHFCLGASIAVFSEHFLTCAPLWTVNLKGQKPVGKCFFDESQRKYKDIYDLYKKPVSKRRIKLNFGAKSGILWYTYLGMDEGKEDHDAPTNPCTNLYSTTRTFYVTVIGGTGWTTLAEETNNLLLVMKSPVQGDITYSSINSENPSMTVMSSMVWMEGNNFINPKDFFNIGFGITSGKFFSNKTMYAFNLETKNMYGVIEFLEYDEKKLHLINTNITTESQNFKILSKKVGTKFGSVLAATDLNKDGLDELIAAEPLHSDEDYIDSGAMYIYLGGEKDTIGNRNYLQIIGTDIKGRFGSAIAVKDIDGDGIAELAVSAPFADEGSGAVYVISGYEVNNLLQQKTHLKLLLSQLKYTQHIQKKTSKTLGYSLQFISDIDENGCSELIAGAPGSGEAVLYKCIQAVDIKLSNKLIDDQVRDQDLSFIVLVCVEVTYPAKPTYINAHIRIINTIKGIRATITMPVIEKNISCKNCPKIITTCENITVIFNVEEPGNYTFYSEVKLITDHIFNSSVFNNSWVVATPYSNLKTERNVSRHCRVNIDEDCKINMTMKLLFSTSKAAPYVLSSSATETVNIRVANNGRNVYETCVYVTIMGAQLTQLSKHDECRAYEEGYRCYLPKPFRRGQKRDIELVLQMPITNDYKNLKVKANLHETCNSELTSKELSINLSYITNADEIYILDKNHDTKLKPNLIFEQQKNEYDPIIEVQEFLINNYGNLTWKNVYAKISTNKTFFIKSLKVAGYHCNESDTEDKFIQVCFLEIVPNKSLSVIANSYISKSQLLAYLQEYKNATVTFEIKLQLNTTEVKNMTTFRILKLEKKVPLAVGQNKLLLGIIATVIGLLVLIVIFIILYKSDFFKRREKQKLLVHKESIRQRSTRRNTHISSVADGHGLKDDSDVEYDDDCAFASAVPKQ